jgi:circadian clock protein KaiC
MAAQYIVAAAERGECAAMFIFDESERTLLARTEGLGMKLRAAVASGKVHIRQVDPGSISIGELVHLIREQVRRGVRVIVIDSLNGYLNAVPEARHLTLQLHELLSYLGQCGITSVMVLAQHGMVSRDMHSEVDVSYLADTVLLLRYFEAGGRVRQALSVLKKRSGAHERTIREFQFGEDGIAIGEPLNQFHGVLTGVPTYVGEAGALMENKPR